MTSCSTSHSDVTSQLESCMQRQQRGTLSLRPAVVNVAANTETMQMPTTQTRETDATEGRLFIPPLQKCVQLSSKHCARVIQEGPGPHSTQALQWFLPFVHYWRLQHFFSCIFFLGLHVCAFAIVSASAALAHGTSSVTVAFRQATRAVHDATPQMILRIKINHLPTLTH